MNQAVFEYLYRLSYHGWFFDAVIVFLSEYLGYFLVLGALVFCFKIPSWRLRYARLGHLVLSIILARGIITEIVRAAYLHPRPNTLLGLPSLFAETSSSFPSGHAAFFFALATGIYFMNRRLGIALFALSFLMGIARVAAGVHWPLDIAGGLAVGMFSAYVIRILLGPHINRLEHSTN
ncbi:MAG: phosphatase PAP2 family protein [Patescibacteria group bacterium]